MKGSDLTQAERRSLVELREKQLGLDRTTKDIDLTGAFYEGGGEIGIAPAYFDMPGQSSEEKDRRLAKVKRSGRGDSAVFSLLESYSRAYKEPFLYVWRGPYMDLDRAERLDDHPATRALGILRRPNQAAQMTMGQVQPAIAKGKLAAGNFYLVKARSGGGDVTTNTDGAVARLWPVWSTRMAPAVYTKADGRASSGWIDYYAYSVGKGKPLQIPIENVIHFRNGLRDDEPRLGIGVVEEFALEVGTGIQAALLVDAVLGNLGVPGLVFSPDDGGSRSLAAASLPVSGINADDRAEIKAMIQAKTTGKRRGEAIVLSRPTKFEQFKLDLEQYDLGHVWQHVETRISAVIGWPAVLAGLQSGLDSAHYNNVKSLMRFATENAAIPTWGDDSETWTMALHGDLGLRDDEWIAYDYRGVRALQEDKDDLWKRANEGWTSNALTIGEHHRLLDLELPEGVDPGLRRAEVEASAQLSSLLRPALGKSKSIIIDGSVLRPAALVADLGGDGDGDGDGNTAASASNGHALPVGQKALPMPATVTIAESDVEDAAREWDRFAAKYAPDYVGIMDAEVVEDEEGEDDV